MPAPILVTAIGTVHSISTVIIKSRVDGEIAKVHFDEGQVATWVGPEVGGALWRSRIDTWLAAAGHG